MSRFSGNLSRTLHKGRQFELIFSLSSFPPHFENGEDEEIRYHPKHNVPPLMMTGKRSDYRRVVDISLLRSRSPWKVPISVIVDLLFVQLAWPDGARAQMKVQLVALMTINQEICPKGFGYISGLIWSIKSSLALLECWESPVQVWATFFFNKTWRGSSDRLRHIGVPLNLDLRPSILTHLKRLLLALSTVPNSTSSEWYRPRAGRKFGCITKLVFHGRSYTSRVVMTLPLTESRRSRQETPCFQVN